MVVYYIVSSQKILASSICANVLHLWIHNHTFIDYQQNEQTTWDSSTSKMHILIQNYFFYCLASTVSLESMSWSAEAHRYSGTMSRCVIYNGFRTLTPYTLTPPIPPSLPPTGQFHLFRTSHIKMKIFKKNRTNLCQNMYIQCTQILH